MKFRLAAAAVAFLTTLSVNAVASVVFIDFETLPGGGAIVPEVALGGQFTSLGVTFSATENNLPVAPTIQSPAVFFGELAKSGLNFANNQIAGFGPSDGDNRADVFTMTFSSLVSGVSFWVDPNGDEDPTFNAYDALNNIIETIVVDASDWKLVIPFIDNEQSWLRGDGLSENERPIIEDIVVYFRYNARPIVIN